jgi:circadian clock protein KaiC
MSSIERIPTGIPGLDEMIEGGVPVPSLILVAGDIGAGKATFCTQFLCKGAERDEPGLYFLIFGGPPEWEFRFASTYEFVKECYYGSGLKYVDLRSSAEDPSLAEGAFEKIVQEIEEVQPRRIVIDKLSMLEDLLGKSYKPFLLKLASKIRKTKAVALVTGESGPEMPYPPEIAHIADGIILLHNTEINMVRRRSLEILKMRGTAHPSGKHALDISSKGLVVYPGL